MTSDFTPLMSLARRSLGTSELHRLCRDLLTLTDESPPWLRERWRSYLTHLCLAISEPPNEPSSHIDPPPAELIIELLAHLLLITPLTRRPSERLITAWCTSRQVSVTLDQLQARAAVLEGIILSR